MRRAGASRPHPALAAEGVVIKPLEDIAVPVLNHPNAAKMIRNLIDWLIVSGSGEESDKKPGPTLLCGRVIQFLATWPSFFSLIGENQMIGPNDFIGRNINKIVLNLSRIIVEIR